MSEKKDLLTDESAGPFNQLDQLADISQANINNAILLQNIHDGEQSQQFQHRQHQDVIFLAGNSGHSVFDREAVKQGDDRRARCCSKAAYGISLAGLCLGVIALVVIGMYWYHSSSPSCPYTPEDCSLYGQYKDAIGCTKCCSFTDQSDCATFGFYLDSNNCKKCCTSRSDNRGNCTCPSIGSCPYGNYSDSTSCSKCCLYPGDNSCGSRSPWQDLPNTMCYREPCRYDKDCCERYNICDRSARVCMDCWDGSQCSSDRDCCARYPYCQIGEQGNGKCVKLRSIP